MAASTVARLHLGQVHDGIDQTGPDAGPYGGGLGVHRGPDGALRATSGRYLCLSDCLVTLVLDLDVTWCVLVCHWSSPGFTCPGKTTGTVNRLSSAPALPRLDETRDGRREDTSRSG